MTRKLIAQMLKALENSQYDNGADSVNELYKAIDAAREYLAAPEPTRSQKLRDAGYTPRPLALPPEDEPEQSEPQPLEDLTGVKVCCGEYATCYRPCTPRGRWLANREAQQHNELSNEEIIKLADYHTTYQIESPSVSGMLDFARAVLAAQRSKT